jgi:hypothetical protein
VSDWRLAECLVVLRAEADAVAPNRSRAYDGTIGDAAHAARPSRHNPNADRVVCARDITHDPEHGMDVRSLFVFLCEHPHPELAYIITNGQIAKRSTGFKVQKYTGPDMHLHHIHVAVGTGPDSNARPPYDSAETWHLEEWKQPEEEDDMPVDTVSDNLAKAAVQKLVAAGIINAPEAHKMTDAVSVGLLWVVVARLLERIK